MPPLENGARKRPKCAQPVFVCLTGLPAVGKSVFARKIQSVMGLEIVSTDEIRMLKNVAPDNIDMTGTVYEWAFDEIQEHILSNRSVVLDACCATEAIRRQAELLANSSGSQANILVEMAVPIPELLDRIASRRRMPKSYGGVDDEDAFHRISNAFEWPNDSERTNWTTNVQLAWRDGIWVSTSGSFQDVLRDLSDDDI